MIHGEDDWRKIRTQRKRKSEALNAETQRALRKSEKCKYRCKRREASGLKN